MTDMERKTFCAALIRYGAQAQITMVFEEMAELQDVLCKFLRGRVDGDTLANIAEEIADVGIMLDQMAIEFEVEDAVAEQRARKVRRLRSRLEYVEQEGLTMAEYIEREAAVKAANEWVSEACKEPVMRVIRLFDKLQKVPAADVAPVVHGRWVSVAGKRDRICSRCLHNEPYKNADDDAEVFEFCPHCGAKMDIEDGGDSE